MEICRCASCTYCDNELDGICPKVNSLWSQIIDWWNTLSEVKINKNSWDLRECILFGFLVGDDSFDVLNYIVLLAKRHIYTQKMHNNNNIFFISFLQQLKNSLIIEKEINIKNNTSQKFVKFNFVLESL